jgi:hypothetical protein
LLQAQTGRASVASRKCKVRWVASVRLLTRFASFCSPNAPVEAKCVGTRASVAEPQHATLQRTQLAIDGARGTATLTLDFTSLASETATTMIEVPRDTRILGMTVISAGTRAPARAVLASTASATFRELSQRQRDPGLLELVESKRASNRLQLSVYPVSAIAPARVEITMQLPAVALIELAAPGRANVELDGTTLKGRKAGLPANDAERARTQVTDLLSLLAADPEVPPLRRGTTGNWCGVGIRMPN